MYLKRDTLFKLPKAKRLRSSIAALAMAGAASIPVASAQAEDVNEKCLSVKGIKEKIKCAQGKYIKFRDSVPKTGVETIEKLNKKK